MDDEFIEATGPAQAALTRMRRAQERGTGCHLTAEMIASLYLTVVGSMWVEDDPRDDKKKTPQLSRQTGSSG